MKIDLNKLNRRKFLATGTLGASGLVLGSKVFGKSVVKEASAQTFPSLFLPGILVFRPIRKPGKRFPKAAVRWTQWKLA